MARTLTRRQSLRLFSLAAGFAVGTITTADDGGGQALPSPSGGGGGGGGGGETPTATPTPTESGTATATATPSGGTKLTVSDVDTDWTGGKYADNPVMLPTTGWESSTLAGPFPMVRDGEILLYYGGYDGSTWRIGRAKSSDGISFQRNSNNPIFDPGFGLTGVPWVVENGTWYLFYTRLDTKSIGYATSSDGVSWSDQGTLFGPTETWEQDRVFNPAVLNPATDDWRMWYYGDDYQSANIGYATASDPGGPWTKHSSNPVLQPQGSGFEADSVLKPRVHWNGDKFIMTYAGKAAPDYRTKTGLVSSTDGVNWTRHHPSGGYLEVSQDWEKNDPRWDEVEDLTPFYFGDVLTSYYSAVNAGENAGFGLTQP